MVLITARCPQVRVEKARKPQVTGPVPTEQERRFESAYPVETERQAVQKAKVLAREDYMKSYEAAIKVWTQNWHPSCEVCGILL